MDQNNFDKMMYNGDYYNKFRSTMHTGFRPPAHRGKSMYAEKRPYGVYRGEMPYNSRQRKDYFAKKTQEISEYVDYEFKKPI